MHHIGFFGAPWRALALAATAGVITACNDTPSEPGGPSAPLNALPRPLTVAETHVRNAANAFSFAWWGRLSEAQPGTNVFVSPLSASFALGMTLNGAANQTFDEMRAALQFGDTPQAQINEGYQSLLALLTSLDPAVKAQIANSVWYRNDFTFTPTFFDAARTYFDAEVAGLDFTNQTGSLATINGWVNAQTNGTIPSVLDAIPPDAVMYLINAIYFKGSWREKFDAARTVTAPFHAAGGSTQSAKLMNRRGTMRYGEGATWQAADLPYGNSAFTMTVVLPAEGMSVDAFAGGMTADTWDALTASLTEREVDLTLPKLTLNYERTLNDDLKALGMVIPFQEGAADFTRMSPAGTQLYISNVKQKAFVDIHEEGTEASAATIVEIGVTSAPVIATMRVDRPYVFVLRERLSGTVLFMGKIARMP